MRKLGSDAKCTAAIEDTLPGCRYMTLIRNESIV